MKDEPDKNPELPSDTAMLDWMQQMRDECEGHVLSRCFLPCDETLRDRIAKFMALNR